LAHENADDGRTLDQTLDWIQSSLGITISESTLRRYLKRWGHSLFKPGKGVSDDSTLAQRVDMYMDFLKEHNDIFSSPKSRWCVIDFTYDSLRNDSRFSKVIGRKGRASPKTQKQRGKKYTSCIVTLLFSDGTMLPPTMFTCNPNLKGLENYKKDYSAKKVSYRVNNTFEQYMRAYGRNNKLEHFERTMDRWGIAKDQVVYTESANKGAYIAESKDIVDKYIKLRGGQIPRGSVLVRDMQEAPSANLPKTTSRLGALKKKSL
jgi:hypothetical protein